MNFDYNSTRSNLILAEYGRNVQNMVDHICTIPEKEERNRLAQVVIDMMGVLNPHLRDVSDFKHKLWDHLYIISDFKIDVDSPYPIPTKEAINVKPQPIPYPQHRIRFKHYGHIVEQMIEKAKGVSNEDVKQRMTLSVANFMKMAYITWNKDSVNDLQIIEDLKELSKGALSLPQDTVLTKLDFRTPPPGSRGKTQVTASSNQKSNQNNKRQSSSNNNNGGRRKMGGASNNNNNNRKSYQSNPYKK
ncbi:DUF4290 domain-containing protein [Sphingobacterium alkalisoli]|uniref:DUF4290 domain-containing protein n=1 Tax=Sphingobacterium alkalisoli TaxID=1874115 RepID=A0A4U0GWI5_9SPHI|nr:DUF4290 domain-containing protein [Sphingobacterium alkalisoli]TJY63485.1 DUF4290 domain-containing protein [Sphingobacterium alkalisoli]GGH26379.1 hypothetical protein GCM10011418_35590 [Sphingobacterium alkalisoli]